MLINAGKQREREINHVKSAIIARYGNLKNFSKMSGYSYQNLNDWLNRGLPPSLRLFFLLCKEFNLDPMEFYDKIS